jgi:hypothetical protein
MCRRHAANKAGRQQAGEKTFAPTCQLLDADLGFGLLISTNCQSEF